MTESEFFHYTDKLHHTKRYTLGLLIVIKTEKQLIHLRRKAFSKKNWKGVRFLNAALFMKRQQPKQEVVGLGLKL